jgi:hypothetical protein
MEVCMLDELKMEDFVSHINEKFVLHYEGGNDIQSGNTILLQLIEVSPLGKTSKDLKSRHGFSLLFKGPVSPVLHQKMHFLIQEDLGKLPIFLVPLGPEADGMIYEAIFN